MPDLHGMTVENFASPGAATVAHPVSAVHVSVKALEVVRQKTQMGRDCRLKGLEQCAIEPLPTSAGRIAIDYLDCFVGITCGIIVHKPSLELFRLVVNKIIA
jgi:hypothetical protein